jgi:hypothetical protein
VPFIIIVSSTELGVGLASGTEECWAKKFGKSIKLCPKS